jgi:mono/diheme cytochrome c family protein
MRLIAGFATLTALTPVVALTIVAPHLIAAQDAVPAEARQANVTTVWQGVYTEEQVSTGHQLYEEQCAECHATGEAPAIVGDRFFRNWFEDSLKVPYSKMRTDMPQNNPGHLREQEYADILAYLLHEAGFPAGSTPLPADAERLAGILITDKSGPGGPVPNFTLVQVVGCLTQSGTSDWTLTNGTRPVRSREPGDSPAPALQALAASPLGAEKLQLMSVLPQHSALKGQKVQAKGFLMRNPTGDRLNLTALQGVAASCTP